MSGRDGAKSPCEASVTVYASAPLRFAWFRTGEISSNMSRSSCFLSLLPWPRPTPQHFSAPSTRFADPVRGPPPAGGPPLSPDTPPEAGRPHRQQARRGGWPGRPDGLRRALFCQSASIRWKVPRGRKWVWW